MKNLIFIGLITLSFSLPSSAQNKSKEKLPAAVLTAFNEKFPDAKKVDWEKENEQEWEAEFKLNGKEYSANFNLKGEWLETEQEIKTTAIPADILNLLDAYLKKSTYAIYEIDEAEMLDSPFGNAYEFELEVKGQKFEACIDAEGKVKLTKANKESDED